MRRARGRAAVLSMLAIALLLAGCTANGDAARSPATASAAGTDLNGTVTVFAAASLTDTFTQIADAFEAEHPGVTVALSFGGSSDLATQIVEGAPADVFASANEAQMEVVTDAELAGAPVTFATNVLTVAVPADNPALVTSFADLGNVAVTTVVCAPQVPCGAATRKLENDLGVDIPAVSEENNVTDVLGKVRSGQADAGVVYVTDIARAGGDLAAVPIVGADAAINACPIAPLTDAHNPTAATAFVSYVTGTKGQAVLADAGFGTP
nr:molybdate ABC transporter substrate-binding protein [Demequina oxidasica]